jgi:hypothetical protein
VKITPVGVEVLVLADVNPHNIVAAVFIQCGSGYPTGGNVG